MKPFLLICTFCCFFFALTAQNRQPSIATTPAWVAIHAYNTKLTQLDKHAEDGVIDIALESVVNVGEQSEYIRHTRKIVSQAGVQANSEVSVSFDPTYQKLIFHNISITRNNQTTSRLVLSKIKVIQTEGDRESYIYNGEQDAVLVLDDVRAGDIIDYSYTLKGFNPIFEGLYASFFSTQFTVPVYYFYYKLLMPKARPLNIKNFNDTLQPVITETASDKIYEWNGSNLKPFKIQDKTPSWFDPYPQFSVSEFESWQQVAAWAAKLFPANPSLSPALAALVKKIDAENSLPEAKIKAAIQFVQDEIRYMGFEMGVHSHKPVAPSKVLQQRFGDCKEKSYLLCTMLNKMGIKAEPVLINTYYKKTLKEWLPSPRSFDHVVARVLINGKFQYFDATISYQRGPLEAIYFPDYQVGLPVTDSSAGLVDIPFRNNSSVDVNNEFTADNLYGPGSFKIVTVNKGTFADQARNDFKSSSEFEMLKSYKKFYTSYFPDIAADSILVEDNDSTGIFTTTEFYTLPKFWTRENGQLRMSVSPFVILSLLVEPADKQRSMPVYQHYPAVYKEHVKINLPEEWNYTPGELNISNAAFRFNFSMRGMFKQGFIEAEFESLKDHVSAAEMEQYLADVKSIDDNCTWNFTYGDKKEKVPDAPAGKRKLPLLPIVLLGAVFVFFVWWSQRRS